MASSVLENVKEEVTCPICLEFMQDPVSADCGHVFCKFCITRNYESMQHEEGVGHCPMCRTTYQFENLRPNRHMANIVESLEEMTLTLTADLCELHGEKLVLFCKEDENVICWLCERSQKHRGHHTVLLEEAEHDYRNQIQEEREEVEAEFKKMRNILDSEEKEYLHKLKKEEKDVLRVLEDSEKQLAREVQYLRELISDVQHQLQGSARAMLQGMKDTMERSKSVIVQEPRTCPKRQKMVFQAPDLKGILQLHQASVKLSASNDHNFVIIANICQNQKLQLKKIQERLSGKPF
ncbi:tripartite motif-containing protein 30A-like isoform X2 [Octodon degus]|uniref:Tripartite motif-containing protein 30A-like isoform X2 n=1 Tax=Octodon degus TaxID=10160 RepID=A0A6P6DCS3_OCTDE|nr:tripartite motif-containing protein 30A-like isoform X2 [Octodon degus]